MKRKNIPGMLYDMLIGLERASLILIGYSGCIVKINNTSLWYGLVLLVVCSCAKDSVDLKQLALGKQIAFDRRKGNCLACHVIADGEAPGNIGEPLRAIADRFQDKAALRELIWDATRFNPETSMPPFGRNKILTESELNQVVDYLWSLP